MYLCVGADMPFLCSSEMHADTSCCARIRTSYATVIGVRYPSTFAPDRTRCVLIINYFARIGNVPSFGPRSKGLGRGHCDTAACVDSASREFSRAPRDRVVRPGCAQAFSARSAEIHEDEGGLVSSDVQGNHNPLFDPSRLGVGNNCQ